MTEKKKVRQKTGRPGGSGTVFRNKKIRALSQDPWRERNLNNVADLEAITERGRRFNREIRE